MKQLVVAIALLSGISLNAQTSGRIIFEEKITVDMSAQIEKLEEMGGMEEMIKKLEKAGSSSKHTLLFNGAESIYRPFDAEEDSEVSWTSEDGSMEMQIVMIRPEARIYRNSKDKKIVEQQDLMGKLFLIEEKQEKIAWKITGEQETIAGYQCQKATYTKDSNTVEAWFTTQIPAQTGPNRFAGLPGMVLKVTARNGMLTITAVEVKLQEITDPIEAPTKGKKVTREEFNAIREAKMAERQEMNGTRRGDGMHIEIDRR